MNQQPPSHVFRVALPEEVSAVLRAAFPDLRRLGEPRAPPEWKRIAERLAGLAALWFDDAVWLSFDGELRQLSRGPAGELRTYALPSRASVLAAIGETEASDYRLVPAYRLSEGRQLWFAFGYGEDTPPGEPGFFAIPVLFSPVGGDQAWTPLRNELGGRRRLRGTSFGEGTVLTEEGRKVLLLGELDAGAEAHLDDFIMVPVSTECDLVRHRFRDAPAGKRPPFPFDTRLLAAHADRFLVDRASTNATDLAFRLDDGCLSGAIRDSKSSERFVLNGAAPTDWDSRFGLCRGSFIDDRALAVDLLDPGYLTVSHWSA